MRVKFDFTQEELFDVAMRSVERGKTVNFFQWSLILRSSMIAVVAMFPPLLVLEGNVTVAVIGTLIAACASGMMQPLSFRSRFEKKMRELCEKEMDGRESLPFELELKEN